MRTVTVVVALVLANAALVILRQSASSERAALVDAASTLAREADQARLSTERTRELDALVAKARSKTVGPRDIGALRDVLVKAEQGLSIDRLSLEFRPEEQQLPAEFGGSRVHASLRGRFEAIYDYLERLESMFLPLSPENLALRGDPSSVTLTIQWAARWPLGNESALELSPTQVSRLNQWLSVEPRPRPDRDIFSFRVAEAPSAPVSLTRVSEIAPTETTSPEDPKPAEPAEPAEPTEPAEPERPVVIGFVLARPELEPDVRRRVLAALRYEGEVRLVMVGDTLGGYVVERMEARESVTLTRADTGERIRLTFE